MDELWIQAGQIKAAVGGDIREIYKKLKENPKPPAASTPKQPAQPTVTDHKKTQFWRLVEADNSKRGGKMSDSIIRVRKDHPDLFAEYIGVANA